MENFPPYANEKESDFIFSTATFQHILQTLMFMCYAGSKDLQNVIGNIKCYEIYNYI